MALVGCEEAARHRSRPRPATAYLPGRLARKVEQIHLGIYQQPTLFMVQMIHCKAFSIIMFGQNALAE